MLNGQRRQEGGGWGWVTPLLHQDLPSLSPEVVAPESSPGAHTGHPLPRIIYSGILLSQTLGVGGAGGVHALCPRGPGEAGECPCVKERTSPYCLTTSLFSSELHDWEPRATATPPGSSNLLPEDDRATEKKGKMVERAGH